MKYTPLHVFPLAFIIAGCGSLGAYNPEFLDSDDLADFADADVDADADADSDTDADADSDTDSGPCLPPDVPMTTQVPINGNLAPVYVGVTLWGVVESGYLNDFSIDGLDDTAVLVFELFDITPTLLCTVIFDASETATQSNGGWITDTGGTVYEGFSFSLNGNDGWTNCRELDGSLGFTDPRAWAASRSWRVGIGEMSPALKSDLAAIVGATWAADFEPYIMSQFIDFNGPQAVESSSMMVYPHQCFDLNGTSTANNAMTSGPTDGYVGNAYALTVYNMASLP